MGLWSRNGPSAAIQKSPDMGQFGRFDKSIRQTAPITQRA
jgi:hypothetical protein